MPLHQRLLKLEADSFISFFFLCTIVLGLILRWQMAGIAGDWSQSLDLRRAHSHLGFYGVLFPMTWIFLQRMKLWVPNATFMRFAYRSSLKADSVGASLGFRCGR